MSSVAVATRGDAGAPAEWREVLDAASGKPYFWNPETNETSWIEPVGVRIRRAAAPAAAAVTAGAVDAGGARKTGGATAAVVSTGAVAGAAAATPAAGGAARGPGGKLKRLSLPPDWQEVLDQATGRVYFWNTKSGKVSWEPPPAVVSNTKAKHRGVICAESYAESGEFVAKRVPKTETSREVIRRALKASFLFSSLSKADVEMMVDAMELRRVEKSEVVIKQGTNGDNFYVVESGDFDIFVNGNKVGARGPGDNFGEKALLYNCPRAATVVAAAASVLWALDRVTFRYMIAHTEADKIHAIIGALRKVALLQSLSDAQLSRVAEAVQLQEFHDSDVIIRKGDQGDTFYIIKSGHVVCTGAGSGSVVFADLHLKTGDYFGERALLKAVPRAANVLSIGDTTCMVLDRKAFSELLGPLREILDSNLAMRVLKLVPILKTLSEGERERIITAFRTVTFTNGTALAREGGASSTFVAIRDGAVKVARGGEAVRDMSAGDYFGEEALLRDIRHDCTFVASGTVDAFVIDRREFEEVLGPLSALIARGAIEETGGGGGGGAVGAAAAASSAAAALVTSMKANTSTIKLTDLERLAVLGAGTFGVVKLTGKAYALKSLLKSQVVSYKQEKNVINEKAVMAMCDHPFVLKLYATYKDVGSLYMLIELVQGGELFTLLANSDTGCLLNDHARFYAACVISALKYMHAKDIVYRDLKPENMLIDAEGYVKVVDMGFAKVVKDRTYTLCGTPEYLAPELVLGKGHHKGVDYWASGVLIYEMLCGYSPFADEGGDQMAICKNIIESDLHFPPHVTDKNVRDLIGNLLQRDAVQRYGCRKNGARDIMNHMWFSGMDWEALERKALRAPWVPPLADAFDTSHFDTEANDGEDDASLAEPEEDGSWHAAF